MSILAVITSSPLAFWSPGPGEMLVLAVVALLLYGGNLPEVARSWGKTFSEFRRGLSGFQNDFNSVLYSEPDRLPYHDKSYDEPHRDDSRFVNGYEETSYAEPDDADEDASENPAVAQDAANDSQQTVTDTSADTVAITADEVEKPNE